jgi:UDP-glucose 4-epimerase
MELENINVMVTGAAGFIGSHLADKLLELKNNVIAYDNFDEYYRGKENNIEQNISNPRYKLVKADILDFENLLTAMKGVDIVFHLAAQPGVRFSSVNPQKTSMVNINGTLNVVLAARKHRVKKIIFASSSCVYGVPKYLPCDEQHPTLPISVYGVSKLVAEKYCEMFERVNNLPMVILRYHSVYGPRQRPDMSIFKFTKAIFQGQRPIVYGNGCQTRDFTYVSDVIEGTILAAESDESDGEVFNIGSGSRTSINEVIRLLAKLIDKSDVTPIYDKAKVGDVPDTQADIIKAGTAFGYRPKITLRKGINTFIQWYRDDILH